MPPTLEKVEGTYCFGLVRASFRTHEWTLGGYFNLFVCFVALRPKSTAMAMAGRSAHLTTHFPGFAWTSS